MVINENRAGSYDVRNASDPINNLLGYQVALSLYYGGQYLW